MTPLLTPLLTPEEARRRLATLAPEERLYADLVAREFRAPAIAGHLGVSVGRLASVERCVFGKLGALSRVGVGVVVGLGAS